MKKVLVLGGTGAMGNHLVSHLADSGWRVTVTTRTKHADRLNIRFITGNAKNDIFLSKLLESKWDSIVDFMVYSTQEFQAKVDKLICATDHYLFLSSARVYAESKTELSDDSPRLHDVIRDRDYLNADEYALAKARQEDLLRQTGKSNWTIIRPYITYSDHRLQLGVFEKEEWLYRALKGRTIIFSRDIAKRITTMTFGGDVARVMAAMVGNANFYGKTFHITCDQSIHWKQVLSIYTKVLERIQGRQPKVLLVGQENFEQCHRATYQLRYDRMYDRLFKNSWSSSMDDKIVLISPKEGLAQCLSNFLIDPVFSTINWRSEACKDRLTGERTSLREIDGWKNKIKYLIIRYSPIRMRPSS
jgi:nucleoside-diphosphate-sugar epimerase